jgi:hypothetical protein
VGQKETLALQVQLVRLVLQGLLVLLEHQVRPQRHGLVKRALRALMVGMHLAQLQSMHLEGKAILEQMVQPTLPPQEVQGVLVEQGEQEVLVEQEVQAEMVAE